MLTQLKLTRPEDIFLDLSRRPSRGIYFCRISGWNQQVHDFLLRYYEAARLSGVILENGLPNPDNANLAYYSETMGMSFQLSMPFLDASLKKWLPRMSPAQRSNVAGAIYDTLMGLKQAGKNDNMLKNAYIKFMCWLYYRFERIIHRLGEEKLPKILYQGSVGIYQLLLLQVLAGAGCDIVLLLPQGEGDYRKADPEGTRSSRLTLPGLGPFPPDFSLKQLRQEIQEEVDRERLYGPKPRQAPCTNAWCSGKVWEDVRRPPGDRGTDPAFFCNCFFRLRGVEDRLTYPNDLYQLQLDLRHAGRPPVIVSGSIPAPSPEEIAAVRHRSCSSLHQLIQELSANIRPGSSQELFRMEKKAFTDLMLEEGKGEPNLNRLTSRGVYLLSWLSRYQGGLFGRWKPGDVAAFFYLGGCRSDSEALFCRFLSRLPVDVVIFAPDRNQSCCLADPFLYEVTWDQSLSLSVYPEEGASLRAGTAAFHAERDLDSAMYQDSGLYRNQQYGKANALTLQTMYEEIPLLWDQEVKYRPNFATTEDAVTLPVIYSKVSGVKDGNVSAYWNSIRPLITPDTFVIPAVPYLTSTTENPMRAHATGFLRNGRVQKGKIREHRDYPYGFLRESMQEHLLDKLQTLIEQRTIRGTFENGTEYTIVATALNLNRSILRQIQRFDFTKKNPKLIYLCTTESALSLEDTIQAAFLNLVGFDILFFVPTGYQCIERYYRQDLPEEHQIGEYLYDLQVPDLRHLSAAPHRNLRGRFFGKGR